MARGFGLSLGIFLLILSCVQSTQIAYCGKIDYMYAEANKTYVSEGEEIKVTALVYFNDLTDIGENRFILRIYNIGSIEQTQGRVIGEMKMAVASFYIIPSRYAGLLNKKVIEVYVTLAVYSSQGSLLDYAESDRISIQVR